MEDQERAEPPTGCVRVADMALQAEGERTQRPHVEVPLEEQHLVTHITNEETVFLAVT